VDSRGAACHGIYLKFIFLFFSYPQGLIAASGRIQSHMGNQGRHDYVPPLKKQAGGTISFILIVYYKSIANFFFFEICVFVEIYLLLILSNILFSWIKFLQENIPDKKRFQ
jgi:hypothetical protein